MSSIITLLATISDNQTKRKKIGFVFHLTQRQKRFHEMSTYNQITQHST